MKKNGVALFLLIAVVIGAIGYSAMFGLNLGGYQVKPINESIKLGLDIEGGVVVVYEAKTDLAGNELDRLMDQTKSVIGRRVDAMGLTEPNITIQGENRIRIELPGVKNAQEAIDIIGQTAQLEFLLVKEDSMAVTGMTKDMFDSEPILTGEHVKTAELSFDQYNNPAVSLEFNGEGSKLFETGTRKAVNYTAGRGQIAILLDDVVISAPMTEIVIADGKAQITGNFTTETASGLATLIRGGALPVELEEVQTSVIGPTLGIDALNSSIGAAKIGFALVVAFMIFYYRVPGVIASISLVLYSSLLLLAMVGFNATLTLPGVAGIVLSVGMAVDANVIIFERIKEEMRNGKTLRASIDSGFSRALRTIVDSNITTLIAAVVLFNFGEGPIQGFAVTLMIGIVVSMFTAVIVTKTLLKSSLAFGFLKNNKLYGA